MNLTKNMCCFCWSASNIPLADIFMKNGGNLTHFDKISSSLTKLSNILNKRTDYQYMVCRKCCDTVDTVYQFNETCLHNIEIYVSYNRIIKKELEQEQYNEKALIKVETCAESHVGDDLMENPISRGEIFIKEEADEVLNLTNICQVNFKKKNKGKSRTPLKHETKIIKQKDNSTSENIDIVEENNIKISKENLLKVSYDKNRNGKSTRKSKRLCDVCGKSFSTISCLKSHISIHTGEKSNICEICNKAFRLKINLDEHKLIHSGEKPHQCDECGRRFRKKNHLNKHKLIHSKEKPYECNVCGKKFNCTSNLNVHKVVHTGERKHKCDICNKEFKQRSDIAKHKLIHGDKQFECDQCHLRFRQKSSLVRHEIVHTGAKPYGCNICEKAFTTKAYLISHKLSHTGVKSFSCDVCKKSFVDKLRLNGHKRKTKH